ncbi:MAG: hypothetical protein ACI4UV_07095, partial [Victivallales bacterium]
MEGVECRDFEIYRIAGTGTYYQRETISVLSSVGTVACSSKSKTFQSDHSSQKERQGKMNKIDRYHEFIKNKVALAPVKGFEVDRNDLPQCLK